MSKSKSINEVHELEGIMRSIKADITAGRIAQGQSLYPVVAHIQKNLRPVMFSDKMARARGVCNLLPQLRLVMPLSTEFYKPKHHRIKEIVINAKNLLDVFHTNFAA